MVEPGGVSKTGLAAGRCPDCGNTEWRLGPRGGINRNVECTSCKRRWNVAIWENILVSGHRIDSDVDWSGVYEEIGPLLQRSS